MRYDRGVNALALLLGFLSSLTLFSFAPVSWWTVACALFLAVVFLFLSQTRHKSSYLLASIFMLAVCAGGARMNLADGSLPEIFEEDLGAVLTLTGKVVDEPDIRETNARLTLLVERAGVTTKILVVAPLFPEVTYGETVLVEGALVRPEAFQTETGRTFRYDLFLAKDGIYALMERASLEKVAPRTGMVDEARGFFSDMKRAGIDALSTALPEPQAGLASGLILGGKQGLGKELLDDFILVGLVHIVVLSGYNVMIVAEAVFRTFGFFAKRYAAFVAGAVILGFVLVAGAGAASVRAGIMAGIALFGRATGRTYDAFRALVFAGILMLLWNPLLLVHDPGFQLSFVATLGLIFGAPITEKWVAFVRSKFLREIISATIAAQIAVLPLLLYQNGLFSVVALPANALVLPLVPLAMAFSALAGLVGFVAPAIAPLAGLPAYALLSLIISATELFATLPFAGVTIPAFPFALVLVAYLFLGIFVQKRLKNPQEASDTRRGKTKSPDVLNIRRSDESGPATK